MNSFWQTGAGLGGSVLVCLQSSDLWEATLPHPDNFLKHSFVAAADKLPLCFLLVSEGWSWDGFCTGRKQNWAVWKLGRVWQPDWMSQSSPLGQGGQTKHWSFQSEPRTSEGFVLVCYLWVEPLEPSWAPIDFTAVNAELCTKCAWELLLAAPPSRQPLHPAQLPFLRQQELHLFFLISVSPFCVLSWHKCMPTANHSFAKEGKWSIFTGTGNKCQREPLQWRGQAQIPNFNRCSQQGDKCNFPVWAVWDIFNFSITGQRRALSAVFSIGNILPIVLYSSIQMYVCVCGILLSFLYPGNLSYITSSTEPCSSPTQDSEQGCWWREQIPVLRLSPLYSRSEVLEHVTSFRRNAQQPLLITLADSLRFK